MHKIGSFQAISLPNLKIFSPAARFLVLAKTPGGAAPGAWAALPHYLPELLHHLLKTAKITQKTAKKTAKNSPEMVKRYKNCSIN